MNVEGVVATEEVVMAEEAVTIEEGLHVGTGKAVYSMGEMSNGDGMAEESVDCVKETVSHQCELCAFKAETEGGLCVHMGRKHKHIE